MKAISTLQTKRTVKRQLTALSCAIVLSSTAYATELEEPTTRKHAIGFGSGLVTGAAVGGPVGAMAGGILGLFIANEIENDEQRSLAQSELDRREETVLAMQEQLETLNAIQVASAMSEAKQTARDIEASIQFRTASHTLEAHYETHLNSLAENLRADPESVVQLSGFADQRGDDTYNQVLSEQRATAVKTYLMEQGVAENQILTEAFGESSSISDGQHREDYFFDRRVVIRMGVTESAMTASH